MKRDKLELKDEYTKEEVLDIVREVVFQITQDLDTEYFELKSDISDQTDPLIKAGMKRKKTRLKEDRLLVDNYYGKTRRQFRTECCDASIKRLPLADGRCSECGDKNYESYEVGPSLETLIKFVNQKIDEEP